MRLVDNRMGWMLIVSLAIFVSACASRETVQPFQVSAVASAAAPRGLSEGEALYLHHCAGCHGWQGRGDGPLARILGVRPPALRGPQIHGRYTEAELTARILYGDESLPLLDPVKIASMEADISALMVHMKRLPQIDREEADKGRESYDSLCAYCHGVYGRGDGIFASEQARPPRDLSAPSFQLQTTDEELLRAVAEGKEAMRGAKDVLSAEDIRSVVAYLRVLSPGYESYERSCARCHGSDGYPPADTPDGIFGVPPFLREDLIGVVFDEDYFRTRPESAVRASVRRMFRKDHSTMPYFDLELSGAEVRKIINYLRELSPELKE
ncbi:MAG: c-type cytochrome [Candidatus Binatia bacterium]